MALFAPKKEEVAFDKEAILQEILDHSNEHLPAWNVFRGITLNCDLLCIRSLNIQKEVSITDNPFSNYRRIVPCTYQIVVGVHIVEDCEDNSLINKSNPWWRVMCVDSADILFRKLEQEE